jgi:nitrogen regulatory protein P-II 1
MKKIEAFIQPFMLDRVMRALQKIDGLPGIVISDAQCVNAERGHGQPDVNKRVEVMVTDEQIDIVLDAIATNARTGKPGDGGIFVTPIEQTVVIRTGERHLY